MVSSPAIAMIDRHWLDQQARIEAIDPVSRRTAPQRASLTARQSMAQDPHAITTVCGGAARSADPAGFFATLGTAFKMPATEVGALRAKCTFYLMGQSDAQKAVVRR
jgi:hypothetical protein